MSTISTHVLDTARGRPAFGIGVRLESADRGTIASGRTDDDGRIGNLGAGELSPGTYRLAFDTTGYFAATGQAGFYPEVVIAFTIVDPDEHYHVPLLLAPYAYSTYRGS
jgi:5-hydroxyisourate hydrolase